MNLSEKSKQIERDILNVSFLSGACHIGSALSCVDILVELYYKILKKEDIFIFSKASGVSTLYCILADKGYFPKSEIVYYLKNYPLSSCEVPGVIWSGGSLGMGLSFACGMAFAKKIKKEKGNVYVLIGDGECQEGTTYEAALFARQHKLDNLYVIIDFNRYQALGAVKDILDLKTAFRFLKRSLPNCNIRKTIKGGNIDFLQGIKGHYLNLTPELFKKALCKI